jgi:hypothetical protein
MIVRVFGLVVIFLGFLVLKYFPGLSDHQNKGMTLSGILIGIIISIIGIIMLIVG